jgi:hypothetical protein
MSTPGQRLITVSLMCLIGGLLALNTHQVNEPIDTAAIAPDAATLAQSGAESTPLPEIAPPGNLSEFPETLARPLFNPDRRPKSPATEPPAPEAATEPPSPPPPPPAVVEAPPAPEAPKSEPVVEAPPPPPVAEGFQLVGVMRKGAKDKRVLIRTPASAQAKWLKPG